MNKLFLGIMMIGLIGCSSDDTSSLKQKLRDLRETNESLQSSLNSCQAKLDMGSSNVASNPEPESTQEVQEPEYEEISVYEVDGTKCYATDDTEVAAPACGRSFWSCNDKIVRECMVNVKYKVLKEKKLIEE